ncbi:MAG TPA: bifunctional homocysteine S-methyltransferase/methylenetetrahydrofolate reductase [Gemmatimonadota bacterium]|jgi:homocysteine S-methyltransferase
MSRFLDLLSRRVVVCDGGMGTMLYQKGVFINQCFDELNLKEPELVEEVHREYVDAGADVLETNTFGANRIKLGLHGLEARVREINRAGVRVARAAAGEEVLVAGSIGPLAPGRLVGGGLTPGEMEEIFREQAQALAEEGVDLFIVETIADVITMEAALRAVRAVSTLPVVAQMTYTEEGITLGGNTPEEVVERLTPHAVEVLGTNCTVGPRPMLDVIQRLAAVHRGKLAAQPNAGLPESVEGRLIYMASPEYLAKYAKRFVQAGVSLLGGCCGTRPEHIRAMKYAVAPFMPTRTAIVSFPETRIEHEPATPVPRERKSPLAAKLADGAAFVTSVELTPPAGTDLRRLKEGVRMIQDAGLDCVNIPEYARVNPRLTPIAIAQLLAAEATIEPIVHYCCRDRNLSGMQADLLGAEAFGIRNVLIITGDPPKLGDYARPTAVFDLDSIGLVKVAALLNRGLDAAGAAIGPPTAIHIGVGANPGSLNLDLEVRRFREKVAAGAEFVMTQPVFDSTLLERFLERVSDLDIPYLVGILPLFSYRNAEFLHNEVPGMTIPDDVRRRMQKAVTAEAAQAEGIRIAREVLAEVRHFRGVRGAYIMPPFGRYEMALKVLDGV